jgi:hypothetical protein
MVDDEACRVAQAEAVAVAVAGADKQLRVLGGPYDLVFHAAAPPDDRRRPAEAVGGGLQEFLGGGLGQLLQPVARIALGVAPAEEPGERAVRGAGHILPR